MEHHPGTGCQAERESRQGMNHLRQQQEGLALKESGWESWGGTSWPATARLSPAKRELQGLVGWGGEERPSPCSNSGPV